MRTINREKILASLGHLVVLKGGTSAEREISLISGDCVYAGLCRLGVDAAVIDVGENLVGALQAARPDLVVNMLHGQGGEDGVVQGLLETMGIPYTGSGVLASALAMDKVKTKLLWRSLGLPTAPWVVLHESTNWQQVIDEFGKVVVKPVSGGSSLGIFIVEHAETLEQKYREAGNYDTEVMAEAYIAGREFSTGILGEQILPTIQLETEREFFDFEAKYEDAGTRLICPPDLSEARQQELNELVRAAYDSLGCKGLARVDLMQDRDENFFLLELNTVPGMTSHSFVPMAASSIGLDFDGLLLQILDEELRHLD